MTEYTVIRSRRRTLALQVTREAQVVVRAPMHASREEIHRFVSAHEDWLAAHITRQAQHLAQHPPLSPQEQEHLRQKARQLLPPLVHQWAQHMGVEQIGRAHV